MTEAEILALRKAGLLHGDAMQCGHCAKLMAAIDEIIYWRTRDAVSNAAIAFLPKL
jgi:hypothetical protein